MGIGTFGAFTQARLAIYAVQTGISVTGNNISNINTPGYTRQRLNQVSLYAAGSDRYYAEGDIRTGQGALVKNLSQIRSPYLDIRYRTENAKVGQMDAKLEGLDEIATILDEVGKGDVTKGEDGFGILGLYFNKIATAMRDLVSETGHQEYDNTVRQTAANLIATFNSYANKLEDVRQQNIAKLYDDVDDINGYLNSIRSLNEEIRKCEIHGDPALELRDDRNRQIDELSELIDINVTYSEEIISGGLTVEKLTISLDDANPDGHVTTDESLLVDGVFNAQISLGKPAMNPYYGVKLDEPSEELDALNKLLDEMAAKGEIADLDEMAKMRQAYVSSPYLSQEKDADGKVIKETPVADIRDATILTDEENPLYNIMISELRDKRGDLNVNAHAYAKETVAWDDIKDLGLKFDRTGRAIVEAEDQPAEGDKTVTIYTRTLKPGVTAKQPADTDYTYTAQVFEHLISKPVALDDNDITGKLQARRELVTEEGEFTDLDVVANIDEGAGAKRGIPYYQKTLDLLANQFARALNEANQGFLMDDKGNYITKGISDEGKEVGVPVTVTYTDAGGDEKTVTLTKDTKWEDLDPEAQAKMQEKDPTIQSVADYLKRGGGKDAEGNDISIGFFRGGVLFSNNPGNDDPTGITAANISISNTWEKTHLLVRSFTCPPGYLEPASGQSDNLTHMEYILDFQKFQFVPTDLDGNEKASGEPMFEGTFFEMWNDIGDVLGHDQKSTETDMKTAYETALAIDIQRDSVSSVDFNDEAMNLMMYSKSYNAACRLMTTIDSVLDKLINNTGMTT